MPILRLKPQKYHFDKNLILQCNKFCWWDLRKWGFLHWFSGGGVAWSWCRATSHGHEASAIFFSDYVLKHIILLCIIYWWMFHSIRNKLSVKTLVRAWERLNSGGRKIKHMGYDIGPNFLSFCPYCSVSPSFLQVFSLSQFLPIIDCVCLAVWNAERENGECFTTIASIAFLFVYVSQLNNCL